MLRIEHDEWIEDMVRLMRIQDATLTAEDAQALAEALWERPSTPAALRISVRSERAVRRGDGHVQAAAAHAFRG